MSVPSPPAAFGMELLSTVREKPRWSVVNEPVRPLLVPLSMAGLPWSRATVWVGPPLLRKPLGSSCGLSGEAIVPFLSVAAVKPVLPSFLPMKLKPCDLNAPKTSGLDWKNETPP